MAPAVAPAKAPEVAPNVETILTKMRELYARADTYRDEGTLNDLTLDLNGVEKSRTTGRFKTRWRAQTRVLFVLDLDAERFASAERLAVWTTSSGEIKELFLGKVLDQDDIRGALRAMQGVTHGITGLIPSWLTSRGCTCDQKYDVIARAACGADECIVLRAGTSEEHVTLHVDTKTFALRRHTWRTKITPIPFTENELARMPADTRDRLRDRVLDPFIAETEIEYTPAFDVPLDESDFAFDPRASSSPGRPGR